MLRIGKVPYLNALPLFHSLRGFDLVEGHPAELVKLLREGKIEGGIVSSVEYFFNPDLYYILPNVSISSREKVCSVLLLSDKPLREIRKIKVTASSLTSRYLISYIFKKIYSITPQEVSSGEEAFLAIGDEALKLKKKYSFTYDLGEEWFKHTKLPFVFALFLIRKDTPEECVRELYKRLQKSLRDFFTNRKVSPFTQEYVKNCIDYSLKGIHFKSLKKFFAFMEEETGKPAPSSIVLFPL